MKNLSQKFLSDDERTRVAAAVKEAEKKTAGEIVVMIISASYHYPMADVIGGVVFALGLALCLGAGQIDLKEQRGRKALVLMICGFVGYAVLQGVMQMALPRW